MNYKKKLTELDLILKSQIINGIYNWLCPVECTAIYKKMLEQNIEFHTKRAEELKKQGQQKIMFEKVSLESGIDIKNEQFIDYIYDQNDNSGILAGKEVIVKQKKSSQNTFTEKQWGLRIKSSENISGFHLFIAGLDITRYTKAQIRKAVFEELNRKVGKISMENIQFIDPHSLLNRIYIESNSWEKADEIMRKYGLVCIVKFNEIMDAIKLLVNDTNLRLPLCNETEKVNILPSKLLVKYIEEYA